MNLVYRKITAQSWRVIIRNTIADRVEHRVEIISDSLIPFAYQIAKSCADYIWETRYPRVVARWSNVRGARQRK